MMKDYELTNATISMVSESEKYLNKLGQGKIIFTLTESIPSTNEEGKEEDKNFFSLDAYAFLTSGVDFPLRPVVVAKSDGGKIIPYEALCLLLSGAKVTAKRIAKKADDLNTQGVPYGKPCYTTEIVTISQNDQWQPYLQIILQMIDNAVKAYKEKHAKQVPQIGAIPM